MNKAFSDLEEEDEDQNHRKEREKQASRMNDENKDLRYAIAARNGQGVLPKQHFPHALEHLSNSKPIRLMSWWLDSK